MVTKIKYVPAAKGLGVKGLVEEVLAEKDHGEREKKWLQD